MKERGRGSQELGEGNTRLDPLAKRGGVGLVQKWTKIMDLGMRWEKVQQGLGLVHS